MCLHASLPGLIIDHPITLSHSTEKQALVWKTACATYHLTWQYLVNYYARTTDKWWKISPFSEKLSLRKDSGCSELPLASMKKGYWSHSYKEKVIGSYKTWRLKCMLAAALMWNQDLKREIGNLEGEAYTLHYKMLTKEAFSLNFQWGRESNLLWAMVAGDCCNAVWLEKFTGNKGAEEVAEKKGIVEQEETDAIRTAMPWN